MAEEIEFEKADIGTLKSDNSGLSEIFGSTISADGRVIVGMAQTDSGNFHAFRYNEGDSKMTDLGTLRNNNLGSSRSLAVSANGRVVVGLAETDSGIPHAFRHNKGDAKMTDLGTLASDNSGYSVATKASADGRVVVGEAQTGIGSDSHAYRHNENDARMTDLGTLRSDDRGNSIALALSADGRVVVGDSEVDGGGKHAFRHNEGDLKMTDLGTLKSDNSGNSLALAISADGRVIVGDADVDGGGKHAFRHNEGDLKMTDLGTLASDNSGTSAAAALSADGRVVIGKAQTGVGYDSHAFRHNEGDAKMTDLGTLKSDNSGASGAVSVSADGRIVVGEAETDSGSTHAFIHREGDEKMTDLGTLKSDNSGYSTAYAVSADGSVVSGYGQIDSGALHVMVWKIKQKATDPTDPENPNLPPETIKVDATNSNKTMTQSAKDAYKVLDLYRSRLMGLSKTECSLDRFSYCVGGFTQYDALKSNYSWTTGLFGAIKLSSQWRMGISVDYLLDSSLPTGYRTQSSSNPGVGTFIGFQQSEDKTGFNMTVSAAYQEQKVDIHRQRLSHTEAGVGHAKIKGKLLNLDLSYGYKLNNKVSLFPHAGISYTKITRGAYQENNDIEFPAYYGELGEKSTAAVLGLATDYYLSDKVSVNTDIGVRIGLDQSRHSFAGHIDYIGAHAYDLGSKKKNQPYVDIGVKGIVTKHSAINLNLGWTKQSYAQNVMRVGVGYSYRF
ncbi:autotransporter domain-containing protein [Neisseria sp. Ec49-e6-T10]|uniref:autotransporter domain-containing protein n=1 Tax=Neisseria sp. Ec49-e6-T10 TaxID=3140744 RepID=UPI003EBF4591